jgi:GDP-L-fucose synthase
MESLEKKGKILITGGTGLVGRNLYNRLIKQGYKANAIGSSFDLRDPLQCKQAFDKYKPDIIFHLAAKVGGIYANVHYKADFYSDNTLINTNVVNECVKNNVGYIFAMGTGCAYPKHKEGQLLYEKDFLDGIPEVTNDAYAYAKRGLLVHLKSLSESRVLNYCYCLPANIYGPHDNFHPMHSHVVPGLIRRFCDAKTNRASNVVVWGDGSAKRDFIYIDDCIDAMLLLAKNGFSGPVNVATEQLTSIIELSVLIKTFSGFNGKVEYESDFPSGQQERRFDITKVTALGWAPKTDLETGIQQTIAWFKNAGINFNER